MKSKSHLVAAVQCRSTLGDVEGNWVRISRLVQTAADCGARLVVTPEASIPGYSSDDLRTIWHADGRPLDPWFNPQPVFSVAEPIPGPTTDQLSALAIRGQIWLLGGMIERDSSHRYYNTAVLLSPDGTIAAKHRKRWPWPAVEPAWATDGDTPPVICPTELGRLGIAICYDIHCIRKLYQPGDIDTLLFPAAWVDRVPSTAYFDRRFPLVARSLGCSVIFSNRCMSPQSPWHGSGQSTIYSANGAILARSPEKYQDDLVIAEIPIA